MPDSTHSGLHILNQSDKQTEQRCVSKPYFCKNQSQTGHLHMTLLFAFFFLSIAFSFLCSILEAVLLSITPSYTQLKIQEGGRTGELLMQYKEDIDRPLSAILTLNTIAHTVGAIGVGVQAGNLFGSASMTLGPLQISVESVIAVIMTLAILVLSEIIPKTIGANNWKSLAPFTVRTLRIMLTVLTPLVWISQRITRGLKKDKSESVLTRADFLAMTKVGKETGTLDEKESTIIRNVLRLEKLTVRDVMTPRTVMLIADEKETVSSFYEANDPIRYSRIPVYSGSPDHITGLVLKDEILEKLADDEHEATLSELKRDILIVQDDQHLFNLFETLTRRRSHQAVAVDNYGSLVGTITLEDIVETLFGMEIMDESDAVPDLQLHAARLWAERLKQRDGEGDSPAQ